MHREPNYARFQAAAMCQSDDLLKPLTTPAGWEDTVRYEQLFFRFYMRFNREHAPIHYYGSGLVSFHPPTPWAQGEAGERPKGDARWTTQVEPGDFTSWNFYSYWHEMGGSPPRGQTWGNSFESRRINVKRRGERGSGRLVGGDGRRCAGR
jgi:hypothetical protein